MNLISTPTNIRLSLPTLLNLAFATALGSLAVHMLVPSLPAIAAEFGVDPASAQLVIVVYLSGLGLGQLIAGPLSDMLGRRPVLIVGIAIFCFMSIACALTPNLPVLVAARLFQAFGAAAVIVSSRAIISDLSIGSDASGRIATIAMIVMLSPTVAPTLGGLISGWSDWRWIFGVLAVVGIMSAITSAVQLPRDRASKMDVSAVALASAYRSLGANTRFRRYALSNASATSGLYIFLVGSPFLLIERWGLHPEIAGLCYLAVSGAGIVGTRFVNRLEKNGGAMRPGLLFMASGAALMVAFALAGNAGPAYLIGPMAITGFGAGIAGPAGIVGAMRAEPGVAGTASSLAGALQMLLSAAIVAVIGSLELHSFEALAASVFAASGLALLVAPAGRSVRDC